VVVRGGGVVCKQLWPALDKIPQNAKPSERTGIPARDAPPILTASTSELSTALELLLATRHPAPIAHLQLRAHRCSRAPRSTEYHTSRSAIVSDSAATCLVCAPYNDLRRAHCTYINCDTAALSDEDSSGDEQVASKVQGKVVDEVEDEEVEGDDDGSDAEGPDEYAIVSLLLRPVVLTG
jgi:hypothetical protein